jgi:hypothetical protein
MQQYTPAFLKKDDELPIGDQNMIVHKAGLKPPTQIDSNMQLYQVRFNP